jgi:hypothetical protein
MHSDHQDEVQHHRNRHTAERMEGLLGKLMVAAIVVLAIGLIWAIAQGGNQTPSWMR